VLITTQFYSLEVNIIGDSFVKTFSQFVNRNVLKRELIILLFYLPYIDAKTVRTNVADGEMTNCQSTSYLAPFHTYKSRGTYVIAETEHVIWALLGYCGAPHIGYTAQLLRHDCFNITWEVSCCHISELCKKRNVIYKFKIVHDDSAWWNENFICSLHFTTESHAVERKSLVAKTSLFYLYIHIHLYVILFFLVSRNFQIQPEDSSSKRCLWVHISVPTLTKM
jgi:hypothetical protein